MKQKAMQCKPNCWAPTGKAFEEKMIIDLHHILLTTGIHYLNTQSRSQSRQLMELLLLSLNCYHSVGFLSLDDCVQFEIDLEEIMLQTTFTQCIAGSVNFAEYLVQEFDYDFLWIEASDELSLSSWYKHFYRTIKMMGVDQHIPILITLSSA